MRITVLFCCIVGLMLAGCGGSGSENNASAKIDAHLNYWPSSTDQWYLSFRVLTENATRVYATGDHITGQYDLYLCGGRSGQDFWWSANNSGCAEGHNHYKIEGGRPDLPFTIAVHIVKASGEETYPVTISSFETN